MVDYTGLIPSDLKNKLTLQDVDILVTRFKQVDGGTGVLSGSQNILKFGQSLGDALSNPLAFQQIFSKHVTLSEKLSFGDAVKYYVETAKKAKAMTATTSKQGDSLHSFSDEEKKGYVDYVNGTLSGDAQLAGTLPLDAENDSLFQACGNTLLMSKLLLAGHSDALDGVKLNVTPANAFQWMENHTRVLEAAKKIGCSIVNIAAEDIAAGTPHLVLGVVWQIIKKNLLKQVQELSAAEEQAIGNLPPEQILFKWMNAHLKASGCPKSVANWDKDLSDGVVYAHLMHHLEPHVITKPELQRVLGCSDSASRVEGALEFAERLGCRKFVTVQEVLKGNPRLNLAFVATLFKTYPNLPSTVDESQFTELKTRLATVEESTTKISEERDRLSDAVQSHRRDLEERDARIAESAERLEAMRMERARLSSERDQLASDLSLSQASSAEKAAELELLKSQHEETSRALQNERQERSRVQKKLDEQIAAMDAAVAELEAVQTQLKTDLATQSSAREVAERALAESEAALTAEKAASAELEASLRAEVAQVRSDAERAQTALSTELASEKEARQLSEQLLADSKAALEKAQKDAAQRESELSAQLEAEAAQAAAREAELRQQNASVVAEKVALEAALAGLRSDLARAQDQAQVRETELTEELERTRAHAAQREATLTGELNDERALSSSLQAEVTALKARVAQWENEYNEMKASLTRQLADERAAKALVQQKLAEETSAKEILEEELQDTQDELEEAREEHDDEKTLLLQRISDLEEELRQLKEVMDMSLDKAAKEKAAALTAAAAAKQQALHEMEKQREEELRKMRSVLTGVTRSGYLSKQSDGLTGGWNKRYVALQGNVLSWYKSEKEFKDFKPKGIIYAEECRVFELGEKKPLGFQLEVSQNGKVVAQHNFVAPKLEDMKEWMQALKEAKKKVIAQRVVVGGDK